MVCWGPGLVGHSVPESTGPIITPSPPLLLSIIWYNPPHSPRTVLIQSEKRGCQNHSGPITSSTFPLWTVTVWSTLQSSEHQNDQTQNQFLPSGNPSHEHLTIIMVHTVFIHVYTIYLTHILSLHFNCTKYTCTYKTDHCYIPVHTIVNSYIVIPYLIILYIICVFGSVTVLLLHCSSIFCCFICHTQLYRV